MKSNVGGIDKTIRIVLGLVILALFFVLPDSQRYWSLVGVVPLLTGLVNFCPLYTLIGINTCQVRR